MRVQISTFYSQQHEIAKLQTIVKRTALLADATNAKNLFVKDPLLVHNVSAQAANKILAYRHTKLMCVLPLSYAQLSHITCLVVTYHMLSYHITCLVRFDLFVLFC